eukprot:Awhi_evm1s7084
MSLKVSPNGVSLPLQVDLFVNTECRGSVGSARFEEIEVCKTFDGEHSSTDCGMSERPEVVMYLFPIKGETTAECYKDGTSLARSLGQSHGHWIRKQCQGEGTAAGSSGVVTVDHLTGIADTTVN